jgi:hypothetical protein
VGGSVVGGAVVGGAVVGGAVVAGGRVVVVLDWLLQTCHQKVMGWLAMAAPDAAIARSRKVFAVGLSASVWPRAALQMERRA